MYVSALQRFVAEEAFDVTRSTADRYERVLEHLLTFLDEVDVAPHLGTGPATLLASERQFGERGAFFRVFGFDELVVCLAGFVENDWLLPARVDARTQISLTGRLLTRLRRDGLLDMFSVACAFLDTEAAVALARRTVSADATRRPRLRLILGGLE